MFTFEERSIEMAAKSIPEKFMAGLTALMIALCLLGALHVGAVYAAEGEPEVDYTDNGIPVLYLTVDAGEFQKVNESDYHTYRASGGSIKIDVPEGFKSDYTEEALPETTGDIALEYIRGRGNSTWQQEKRPYKIKLDKKTELLGMGKNKHWVLITNYDDDSLLKNRLVLYMGRALGLKYTPKCAPVDFVVNGKYLGSYLLCEDVRVDKNRVAIDELKQSDTKEPEITGGYILGMAPYDDPHKREPLRNVFWTDGMVKFKTDSPEFWSDDSADQDELGVKAQKEYIEDYVQKTEDAIMADDFKAEDGTPYSDLMDTESAAKYWWVQYFVENGDAFVTPSTYLYKERDKVAEDGTVEHGKLFWGPLWDFDLTLDDYGNDEGGYDFDMSFSRTTMLWLDRLRGYNAEYQELLRKTWKEYDAVLEDIVKDGGVLDTMLAQTKKSWEDDKAANIKMDYTGTAESEAELVRKAIRDKRKWVNENIDKRLGDSRVKVTFKADGKTVKTIDWVSRDALPDIPEAPEISGKTFMYWEDDGGIEYIPETGVEEDTVFTAKYVENSKVKRPDNLYFQAYETWADIHRKAFCQNYTVTPIDEKVSKNVKWTSDNPNVAEPMSNGYLRLKKTGDAVITGTVETANGKLSRSYTLHVFDAFDLESAQLPLPEKITPEKETITLKPGEYAQVGLDMGTEMHNTFPNYYSDQDNINVNDCGVVTALSPGKAVVNVTFDEGETVCRYTVVVSKFKNQMKAKGKTVKVKASKLRKKAVKIARKKAIKLTKSKAKLTYRKLSGSKKITINKKTGNLTIKKGLKKGTYKVKIRLTSGDKNYTKKTKKVTVKVVVK